MLPKLLSVPDSDGADAVRLALASELDGKIARMTSLVRLCHRTSVGQKMKAHRARHDTVQGRQKTRHGATRERERVCERNNDERRDQLHNLGRLTRKK